jgi:DNA-binding MarR family transcriptional regulator
VRIFLEVVRVGATGIDQGQLGRQLGLSPSATIRAVRALGTVSWVKDDSGNWKEGKGLLRTEQDTKDFRLRNVFLTDDGKRLARLIGL